MDGKYFDSEAIMRYHNEYRERPARRYYASCKMNVKDLDLAKRLVQEGNLLLKDFQRENSPAGGIGSIVADYDKSAGTVTFGTCLLDCKDRLPGGDEQLAAILAELQQIFGGTNQHAKAEVQLGTDLQTIMKDSTFYEEALKGLSVDLDVEALKLFKELIQRVKGQDLMGMLGEVMGPQEVQDAIKAVLMLKVNANIAFELEDSDQHDNNPIVHAAKKYNLQKLVTKPMSDSDLQNLNKVPSENDLRGMSADERCANQLFLLLFRLFGACADDGNDVEFTVAVEDFVCARARIQSTNVGNSLEYLARCFFRHNIVRA